MWNCRLGAVFLALFGSSLESAAAAVSFKLNHLTELFERTESKAEFVTVIAENTEQMEPLVPSDDDVPLRLLLFEDDDMISFDKLHYEARFYIIRLSRVELLLKLNPIFQRDASYIFIGPKYADFNQTLAHTELRKSTKILFFDEMDNKVYRQYPKSAKIATFNGTTFIPDDRDYFRTDFKEAFRDLDFPVGNFHYPPYTCIPEAAAEGVCSSETGVTGIEINIVRTIAESLGLKVAYHRPSDGGLWGTIVFSDDGSVRVSGLYSDINRGVVKLGHAQFFNRLERKAFMDQSTYYEMDGYCAILRRPQPSTKWLGMVAPFQWQVWLAYLLTLAFSSMALVMIILVYQRRGAARQVPKVSKIIVATVAAPFNQSVNLKIRAQPFRLAYILFILPVMVMAVTYSGSLMSFLTVVVYPKGIHRIVQLNDFPGKAGAFGFDMKRHFKESANPYIQKLGDDDKYEGLRNWTVGEDMAERGELAFFDSRTSLEVRIRSRFTNAAGETDMRILDECWENFQIVLGFERNSLYLPFFDRGLMLLRERGIIDFWKRTELNRIASLLAAKTKKIALKPLAISDLQSPFILFMLITVVNCLVFILEIISYRSFTVLYLN